MITDTLLNPGSIAIIGASNDTSKPGGKVLANILAYKFTGKLYAVNPKENEVQGIHCYPGCEALPGVNLAILAVAANHIEHCLHVLTEEKSCKAFIIFSAGFSENGPEGKLLEQKCAAIVKKAGATLIGPNCIGVITGKYKGVFAGPIPEYDPMGCDCVSASGATMVYILETAIPRGLKFRDIFSVGNSAQIAVEDVLEYWDETFDPVKSSTIKLLYMEQIKDPQRFLKHARSLVMKGCRIAAIKAGNTDAGSRAVSSHTGALAGSDSAVSALFRKAGVVRCYSRVELVYVAEIFTIKPLKGDRIAVITHAGGPGVMLTDALIKGGMKVPRIEGPKADVLLSRLLPGSSVSNPIDFLATGTAKQLGEILDFVEHECDEIDGSVVVFGTTGMCKVDDAYLVLHEKMKSCNKPVFPILPSVIQAAEEVNRFHDMGHVNFTDEVTFGYLLSKVNRMSGPFIDEKLPVVDKSTIRNIIGNSTDEYLHAEDVFQLLDAAGIKTVKQGVIHTREQALKYASLSGFPLVMKVSGPVHKSELGGVVTGVQSFKEVEEVFNKLIELPGADGVILQQQLSGLEIYIGAKAEEAFGHQIVVGLGGVFVEVFKDVSYALAPVCRKEAVEMIRHLKSYPMIKGVRGKTGVNENSIADVIVRLSALLSYAPEIIEMDINPLIGNRDELVAVDARILIKRGIMIADKLNNVPTVQAV